MSSVSCCRCRHLVHRFSEGPERTSWHRTYLLQWQSMVRVSWVFRICCVHKTEQLILFLPTATRCSTGKQNLSPTFLIWPIYPITGVVMANQLECKLFLITHEITLFWVLFLYCYDLYVFRYHHTGPVSGFFALRESLAILAEKVKQSEPLKDIHYLLYGLSTFSRNGDLEIAFWT